MRGCFVVAVAALVSCCLLPASLFRFIAQPARAAGTCSYSTWVWDTKTKRSVNHARIVKPYYQVTPEERAQQTNCTVCEEDQEAIQVEGHPPIYICRDYAEAIRRALNSIRAAGFPIRSLEGYRVGRSKGPADKNGLRTQFSNHSYGTALDINAEQNGLYTDCFEFSAKCQLLRGGPWRPEQPGTLTKDSVVYRAFRQAGWKWGGELVGRQKDFMHLSLLGD